MKSIIFSFIVALIVISHPVKGQGIEINLLTNTAVNSYELEIGYYTTTVLIFPSEVIVGDRGSNEIIASKEKGLANVLKLKAAKKNFNPTNLHAFTSDGKVYPFKIIYSEHPKGFTFDLKNISNRNSDTLNANKIIISGNIINDNQMQKEIEQVKISKPFFRKSTYKYEMKLILRSIYITDSKLLIRFDIINKSNLAYDVDFIRTCIQDRQKVNRTSFQEKEILPLYKDIVKSVPGKSKIKCALILPKFTLSNNKRLLIEVFEKNGERNLSFQITNRELFRVKKQ